MSLIPFYKKCRTCGAKGQFQDGSPGCSKFKIKIDLDNDYCSWHQPENAPECTICHQKKEGIYLWYDEEYTVYCPICPTCFAKIGTCDTCTYGNICELMTDQSEPPYVMQTVRQGPMIMQQQVKNPNLIARHCNKCCCSFDGKTCNKENEDITCNNWKLNRSIFI